MSQNFYQLPNQTRILNISISTTPFIDFFLFHYKIKMLMYVCILGFLFVRFQQLFNYFFLIYIDRCDSFNRFLFQYILKIFTKIWSKMLRYFFFFFIMVCFLFSFTQIFFFKYVYDVLGKNYTNKEVTMSSTIFYMKL